MVDENLYDLSMAKKRDHKIWITDEAIKKVPYIKYKEIPEIEYENLQLVAQDVLKIAKEQNNSNEVAIIYSLENEKLIAQGKEYMGISLGDEHSVNPVENPTAFHLVNSTFDCVLICLHNHPSLSKLSLDDVKFFLRNESVKMIVAVTNLGDISYMVKTGRFDWNAAVELYNEAVDMHNYHSNDLRSYQKAANHFIKMCYKANIIYEDR